MNELLTVFTPTYQRPDMLKRKLFHMAKQGCEFKILIIDTSNEDILEKNKAIIDTYSKTLNLEYHVYPQTLSAASKLAKGASLVTSKYTITSFDDDFLNLGFVRKGITFLENNSDFDAVTGYVLGLIRNMKSKDNNILRLPILTADNDFSDIDPRRRVQKYISCSKKSNQVFNLRRTDKYRQCMQILDYSAFHKYSEYMLNMLLTFSGRMHFLDDIMEMRWMNYDKVVYRKKAYSEFRSGLYKEFSDPDFTTQLSKFMDIAKQLLSSNFSDEHKLTEFVMAVFFSYRMDKVNFDKVLTLNKKNFILGKLENIWEKTISKVDYFNFIRKPSNLLLMKKLLKIYNIHNFRNMMRNDEGFMFNKISLEKSSSKYAKPYKHCVETMNEFREIY
jgi:glycosyltransferase domain-containing protein